MEQKQLKKEQQQTAQCEVPRTSVAWPILHFISPVKVYIHPPEHPQGTAEVNKGHVNMHACRQINLSATEQPRIKHSNVKKTAPDHLNVTSIASTRIILLTDVNAVNSHVYLNLFDSWVMRGSIFSSQVNQGIGVQCFLLEVSLQL